MVLIIENGKVNNGHIVLSKPLPYLRELKFVYK